MSAHKPLSDEELDGLDSPEFYFDPHRRRAVIAQAREANRLMADLQALIDSWRSEDIESASHGCAEELEARLTACSEDPAARAKRELGEWLAEKRQRTWDESDQTKHSGRWVVELWESSLDPESDCDYRGAGPTEHEAITAALRAAKESGR